MVSTRAVAKSPFETASRQPWPTVSAARLRRPAAGLRARTQPRAAFSESWRRSRFGATEGDDSGRVADGEAEVLWRGFHRSRRPPRSRAADSNPGARVGEADGAAVSLAEGVDVGGLAEGDGVGPRRPRARLVMVTVPASWAPVREDGAAVPQLERAGAVRGRSRSPPAPGPAAPECRRRPRGAGASSQNRPSNCHRSS